MCCVPLSARSLSMNTKKHDKNALQQIDIYFRYIGSMAEPKAAEENVIESETKIKITAIA